MTDARLERHGEVIADTVVGMPYAGAVTLFGDMSREAELVFDGCGEQVRIPVVHTGSGGPSIEDYCEDAGAFVAEWRPSSSEDVAMLFQHFEAGFQCRASDQGRLAFPTPLAEIYFPELEIQHPLGAYDASVGRFELFEIRPAQGGRRKVSVPRADGGALYGLPTRGASGAATFEIDGVVSQVQDLRILVAEAGLADVDPNARVHLVAETMASPARTIRLTTSSVTDTIEVVLSDVTYRAEVAHAAPAVGITLDPVVEERYEVSLPPTVMQDGDGNTKSVGIEFEYAIGFLAVPCEWR